MSEESVQIIRSAQCAIGEMFGVSLLEATVIYYSSETSHLIEEGVSDLHCRSDKYLAEEVWNEYSEKRMRK